MVQKGRETSEVESRGNKRQKEAPAHDTRNASTKRQSRTSDQTSPPTGTPRKRVRAGSSGPVPESPIQTVGVNQEAEVNNGVAGAEINIDVLREHEVEKRLEQIKQLLEQKENELKELAYLEAGHNLMDYNETGFMKGKVIQVAKEEPGEIVAVAAEVPKKGPGRPAKDPSQARRRSSQSTVAQSPIQSESLQAQSPIAQTPSAPQTPVQPAPQTPTQPAEPAPQGNTFCHYLRSSCAPPLFLS